MADAPPPGLPTLGAPAALSGALAGLITVVLAMNTPVLVGLWKSRDHSRTKAYRLVAFTLVLRVCALAWVIFLVG